jgi:hypothetical protein
MSFGLVEDGLLNEDGCLRTARGLGHREKPCQFTAWLRDRDRAPVGLCCLLPQRVDKVAQFLGKVVLSASRSTCCNSQGYRVSGTL